VVEYCECLECGFVLEAADGGVPDPKRWDSCPDCGGASFERIGEE
jgi:rubredoxin